VSLGSACVVVGVWRGGVLILSRSMSQRGSLVERLGAAQTWKTKPILLRRREASVASGALGEISCPNSSMVPPVALSMHPMMLSNVVLPPPDGPRSTTNSPSMMGNCRARRGRSHGRNQRRDATAKPGDGIKLGKWTTSCPGARVMSVSATTWSLRPCRCLGNLRRPHHLGQQCTVKRSAMSAC
jgi:hypothetical protein